jgi:hypothetical protein
MVLFLLRRELRRLRRLRFLDGTEVVLVGMEVRCRSTRLGLFCAVSLRCIVV